jgi:hypothetical protein
MSTKEKEGEKEELQKSEEQTEKRHTKLQAEIPSEHM